MEEDNDNNNSSTDNILRLKLYLQETKTIDQIIQDYLQNEAQTRQQPQHPPNTQPQPTACPEWTKHTYKRYIAQAMSRLGQAKAARETVYETLEDRKRFIKAYLTPLRCRVLSEPGAEQATFNAYGLLDDQQPLWKFPKLAKFAPRGMLHQVALEHEARYARRARALQRRAQDASVARSAGDQQMTAARDIDAQNLPRVTQHRYMLRSRARASGRSGATLADVGTSRASSSGQVVLPLRPLAINRAEVKQEESFHSEGNRIKLQVDDARVWDLPDQSRRVNSETEDFEDL